MLKTEEKMISRVFQFVSKNELQISGLEISWFYLTTLEGNWEQYWFKSASRVLAELAEKLFGQAELQDFQCN